MTVEYTFKALTDVWTGNIDRKNNKCISAGLIGSIRWWFEVLVRGLDGQACDPSDTQCKDKKHCVVCELFGCTGWARKFRFEVLDEKNDVLLEPIKKDKKFILRFTELRPICNEELTLLDATLRLIAEYGAVGGKTVLKPSDEPDRAGREQHKDYGLIKLEKIPFPEKSDIGQLKAYLSKWREVNHNGFEWASLRNFWYVTGTYLTRKDNNSSTFNKVLGRKEPKHQGQQITNGNNVINQWLAGKQQESKKVFSFKNPVRTFGFVNPKLKIDFSEMKRRLTTVWPDFKDEQFIEGHTILDELFGKEKSL
ncbi:MAG: type III-B CRISPR module RAMP protein Cmr1 [Candidatus Omnitrophica bacterium]|nr:type III-B CRISPR module RAMP protein Cmr1 [Candidatus Omnitrophota bacterium]